MDIKPTYMLATLYDGCRKSVIATDDPPTAVAIQNYFLCFGSMPVNIITESEAFLTMEANCDDIATGCYIPSGEDMIDRQREYEAGIRHIRLLHTIGYGKAHKPIPVKLDPNCFNEVKFEGNKIKLLGKR